MTKFKPVFFTALVLCLPAASQELPGAGVRVGVFEHAISAHAAPAVPTAGVRQMAVEWIGAEFGEPGQVVKGAPYSAEAVTEMTQTLADGNRIRHKNTAQLYRDSEGRTRREASFGATGLAPIEQMPKLVFINDPVAGAHYVLDAENRTFSKSKIVQHGTRLREVRRHLETPPEAQTRLEIRSEEAGGPALRTFTYRASGAVEPPDVKTEALGRRVVEGVPADGIRTVMTIAAGKMGNERPIEIVTERWTSPELQTLVLSRHSDPRSGETVYKLTNISRGDPPRSLFEPPADFKETENKGGDVMRLRVPAPARREE